MSFHRISILLVIAMLSVRVVCAANPDYDYKIVAMSGETISGIQLLSVGLGTLRDDGTVLFIGRYNNGTSQLAWGLFRPHSVIAKTGDTIDGYVLDGVFSVAANDGGGIVFDGKFSGGGLFRRRSKVVVAGDVIDDLTINMVDSYALNDSGEVVFGADYTSPSGPASGIFSKKHVLIKPGDTIEGNQLTDVSSLSLGLSKDGDIAFEGVVSGKLAILTTQQGLVVKVGDTIDGIELTRLGNILSMSEAGVISFSGNSGASPGIALFTPSSVIAKSGDIISGLTVVGFEGVAALNYSGDAVFLGVMQGGSSGVFTKDAVITYSGDTLLGHRVISVTPPEINDTGQIAFVAYLDSGSAVVVATPKASSTSD